MSGNKWRIEQNGQFLGHHMGHTAGDAVEKAIKSYGPCYNIDPDDWFDVYKGSYHTQILMHPYDTPWPEP